MTNNLQAGFGITVYMPGLQFEVELSKQSISDIFNTIDGSFNSRGIADNVDVRSVMTIRSAVDVAGLLCDDYMEKEQAIHEIAQCFIYTFTKAYGIDRMMELTGLIGCLDQDRLTYNPCITSEEYISATEQIHALADQLQDDPFAGMETSPTIH